MVWLKEQHGANSYKSLIVGILHHHSNIVASTIKKDGHDL